MNVYDSWRPRLRPTDFVSNCLGNFSTSIVCVVSKRRKQARGHNGFFGSHAYKAMPTQFPLV